MEQPDVSVHDPRATFLYGTSVRDVAEPLQFFDWDDSADEVRAFMEQQDCQVVGIRRDGKIEGFCALALLDAATAGHSARSFEDWVVLPGSSPLIAAVEALRHEPWVFMDVLGRVESVVTLEDLQKAPARMWLIAVISMLDAHFLRAINRWYQRDTWVKKLDRERVAVIRQTLEERRTRNPDTRLVDCLQLADKIAIIAATRSLRRWLGFSSRGIWSFISQKIDALRNRLVLAQPIDWSANTLMVVSIAEQLVARCEGTDGHRDGAERAD